MPRVRHEVLVLGGGINGLSTLYQLRRRGCAPVALLEQFFIGHDRGSSHGKARIIRSTYASADYVRLVQAARREEWPRLQHDAGATLIHPTPGCFFGPPGNLFESYAAAVLSAEAEVERLTPNEGRKRFPWFRFENCAGVLDDHTAGVVAAEATIQALARLGDPASDSIHERTKVLGIDRSKHPIVVSTDRGEFETERLVITVGGWLSRLFPSVEKQLQVARQTVGYFRLSGDAGNLRPGSFPVWVYLEDGENNVYYGLPEFGREGIKIGRHVTSGVRDDPDQVLESFSESAIEDLRRFLEGQLATAVGEVVGAEHCLYTNSPSEDFILDLLPGDPRIAVGSACSGHGFKFGPMTGRILAELVLDGKTSIPEFEAMRQATAFPSMVAST